jgi:hypothetical protein
MQEIKSHFPKNYFTEKTMIASLYKNYTQSSFESKPFALKLTSKGSAPPKNPHKGSYSFELWDLQSFRPDILDNEIFTKTLETDVKIIVLYEKLTLPLYGEGLISSKKLTSTNLKNIEIPRYIIWEYESKIYIFVNIR